MNPGQVSVVQLAMLQQVATSLRWTFAFATMTMTRWPGEMASLKNFYRLIDLKNKMKDGCMPYSPEAGASGVSLEVRYESQVSCGCSLSSFHSQERVVQLSCEQV